MTLRVVKEGDVPAVPPTISAAVASGSSRDVLAAMRRDLAQKLDEGKVSSNAIASAYKELRELDRLIRLADAEAEKEAAPSDNKRRRSFDSAAI